MINEKGFTLVEMLVVIAIVGIIAIIAFPKLHHHIIKAELVELKSDIRAIQFALDYFYIEKDGVIEEDEWENVMKENIDVEFVKLEDSYKFSSGYKYGFKFIKDDVGKLDYLNIYGFKINQSMSGLLKKDDFEFSVGDSEDMITKDNLKDDFFIKYDALIKQDGAVKLKMHPCE